MTEDELIVLNEEITDMEQTYIELKMDYESKKASIMLHTDFATIMGKAKPTVAEKEAFIKMECLEEEERYKELGVLIGSKKRELEIRLAMLGDD